MKILNFIKRAWNKSKPFLIRIGAGLFVALIIVSAFSLLVAILFSYVDTKLFD